jgi:hypothetical protein
MGGKEDSAAPDARPGTPRVRWTRWGKGWLYNTLGLFHDHRVRWQRARQTAVLPNRSHSLAVVTWVVGLDYSRESSDETGRYHPLAIWFPLLTNLKLPELAKGHAEGQDQHGIPKRAGLAVKMPVRQPYTYQIEIYSAVIVPIAKTAGKN